MRVTFVCETCGCQGCRVEGFFLETRDGDDLEVLMVRCECGATSEIPLPAAAA